MDTLVTREILILYKSSKMAKCPAMALTIHEEGKKKSLLKLHESSSINCTTLHVVD